MHVFLCLNNSLGNKWFNFKIPLKASAPSYPFQHAFWWYIWSPLCPNSIMFWPKGKCLVYSSTNLPKLSTSFLDLFHNALNMTWITPLLKYMYPSMCVHTSHQPYGYPPFMLCSWQWVHMNPWCNLWYLCCHCEGCWFPCGIRTNTCVSFKHFQLFLLTSQHVFTKNDICTLVNIAIANPIWMDLLPWSCTTQGFVTSNAVQANKQSYYDWHPIDQLFPLTMEVFGCLHR